jgi:hypothetical protein
VIRGKDTNGTVVLGITRTEVDGLVAGKPCFFTNRPEVGGGSVICLWFAETDAELIDRLREIFASGPVPVPLDLRTKRQP